MDMKAMERAFDKMCVDACSNDPDLKPHSRELLVFAEMHERRPLVLQNLARELRQHERHRGSYRNPAKFKDNARLIIFTVAHMFMKAIKVKRDQDNMSLSAKIALASKNNLKEEISQIVKEVPRGSSEETH